MKASRISLRVIAMHRANSFD